MESLGTITLGMKLSPFEKWCMRVDELVREDFDIDAAIKAYQIGKTAEQHADQLMQPYRVQ